MDRRRFLAGVAGACGGLAAGGAGAQPRSWQDDQTGRRVVQFVEGNSKGFYFHQNPFTAFGDKMVFRAPTPIGAQAFVWDFRTRRPHQLTRDDGGVDAAIVGPRTRTLYYRNGRMIRGVSVDRHETRDICELPGDLTPYPYALSADEQALASGYVEGGEGIAALPRSEMFVKMFEAHLRNVIYTIDVETGHYREIHDEPNWLGHFQFSPTDPNTLMFCHEGPWERLDRIWLLDIAAGQTRLGYRRTREGEIAGHEFWDPSGRSVWFDLRHPGRNEFYLANMDIESGETTRYPLEPEQWSVHYNIGRRGGPLCGDGGSVGPWVYLYQPQPDGTIEVGKLCSLEGNDYATCEPNVHMTPNGKWVVFTSNMGGDNALYGVEAQRQG